jgi:simple sugar transport system ATP-binding protein
MKDNSILSLENVSKYFGNIIALRDVTLRLRRSEVHCLLGDNGAGKSTLIKILSGVYPPNEGQYFVEGKPVNFTSPKDALDHGIATVYQDLALVPLMSVARNFFLGREPKRKVLNLFPVMDLAVAASCQYVRRREAVPCDRPCHLLRSQRLDS